MAMPILRRHFRVTMHSKIQRAACAAFMVLAMELSACGGGGSSGDAQQPVEAVGQVVNSTLRSDSNGFTYPIQVFLPQSYAAGTATLPVIYATEGDMFVPSD